MEFLQGLNWDFIHNTIVLLAVLTAWAVPARMWRKQEMVRRMEMQRRDGAVTWILSHEVNRLAEESSRIIRFFEASALHSPGQAEQVYRNPMITAATRSYMLPAARLLNRVEAWCTHVNAAQASWLSEITLAMDEYRQYTARLEDPEMRTIVTGEAEYLMHLLRCINQRCELFKSDLKTSPNSQEFGAAKNSEFE